MPSRVEKRIVWRDLLPCDCKSKRSRDSRFRPGRLAVVDSDRRMKLVNNAAEASWSPGQRWSALSSNERWWCADGSGQRDAAALLTHAVSTRAVHGTLRGNDAGAQR